MRRSPCCAPTSALLTALLMGISTHLCPVTHAASPVPYVVEFKTGEQFERQTQASTGRGTPAVVITLKIVVSLESFILSS
jgi:hypothetical protein